MEKCISQAHIEWLTHKLSQVGPAMYLYLFCLLKFNFQLQLIRTTISKNNKLNLQNFIKMYRKMGKIYFSALKERKNDISIVDLIVIQKQKMI